MVATGETVMRETPEPGAVLTRLARSHVRFGAFRAFFPSRSERSRSVSWPILRDRGIFPRSDRQSRRLVRRSRLRRTAMMVAQWQAVGFSHGVMNTDNMSILGLTLDYGPCGFMDAYDPKFICNHTDRQGRYSSSISRWSRTGICAPWPWRCRGPDPYRDADREARPP